MAQSAASLGASFAEQFYVSVSRARDSVTVYTDDKKRLAETIQSCGARMTAHEMLKLPIAGSVMDPFESMLREKAAIPSPESFCPDLKREKEHASEKHKSTEPTDESKKLKQFSYFDSEHARHGISM